MTSERDRELDATLPGVTTAARAALAAYLLVPAVLTLSPSRPSAGARDFTDAVGRLVSALTAGRLEVSTSEVEVLANVLLLVPVGLLLVAAAPRWSLTLLLAIAATGSLAVEVVQRVLLPERVASLVDVLSNTGGAAIGLVVALDLRRLLGRRRRARDEPSNGPTARAPRG